MTLFPLNCADAFCGQITLCPGTPLAGRLGVNLTLANVRVLTGPVSFSVPASSIICDPRAIKAVLCLQGCRRERKKYGAFHPVAMEAVFIYSPDLSRPV